MADKFHLNETLSPIEPSSWRELNENWDRIRSYLRHLQSQIKILAGGQEIDEVINRIEIAISNAQNATESANEAIEILNIELPRLITAINNANTAIANADAATNSAINATSAANVATANATEATNLAIDAADGANSAKTEAELATANANAATNDALEATELATDAKNDTIAATTDALSAITEMRQLISNVLHRGDWNSATNYYKNNLVSANGQAYIAVQNNINKVVTDTTNWRLFAAKGERGEKGDTGAALSILDQLTSESQLPTTGEPGEAYTVNGDLYVWSENSNQWINVGNIKGEKGEAGLSAYQIALVDGFIGTEAEWLASLKGERGEKGNNGSDASVTKTNITNALGYTPANNEDFTALESDFSTHSAQTDQTLTNHESRLNQLESGSSTAKADVAGLNREVAYLKLKQDASERIEGGIVFADDFKGNRFGFVLDEANSENVKVKNGKLVMVKDEIINPVATNIEVAPSPFTQIGNGGRKLVRLDNGTLIAAVRTGDSTNIASIRILKSTNNGQEWSILSSYSNGFVGEIDLALATDGTAIYVISSRIFNATTANVVLNAFLEDGTRLVNFQSIDVSQTKVENMSLAIDQTNGHLHAAWASKNATYPNSFNIRYAKSTDGGVTWSTAEQVTNYNNSSENIQNPSIIVRNDIPSILVNSNTAIGYLTKAFNSKTDFFTSNIKSDWGSSRVYYMSASYNQSKPSAAYDKDGVIHVAWHGVDSVNTSTNNIRYSKSTDGGRTWFSDRKLTTGNTRVIQDVSIVIDYSNDVYVICHSPTLNKVLSIKSIDNGDNFGIYIELYNGSNPSVLFDSSYSLRFTIPPVIYMESSTVKFSGNWTETQEVPTTSATVTYDIPSTDYVGAFVQTEGDLTVTAKLNGNAMDSELENNEYEFEGRLTSDAPATLRLELSRPNTTGGENDAVTLILGGRS